MVDLDNRNTAVEFYETRYESGYMEEWDDLKKSRVREVLISLELPPTGKALDFGCGNGVFTKIIKEELPGWEVYGMEISRIAVQNASGRLPDCHFFVAEEAGHYKHQFDFLFSHHVLEHVQSLDETFTAINQYLKPVAAQLHILPCGNPGSFEHQIVLLKKGGIEQDKANRFFFEEPGHLRRLTAKEFAEYESQIGFGLKKSFYSGQYAGSIDWITKSSPRFVRKLTDTRDAVDGSAFAKLKSLRRKLLLMTYVQFPYSKYLEIKSKWHKKPLDYFLLIFLFIPAMIARPYYMSVQKKAINEWIARKKEPTGSEMFLFFSR